MKMINKVLLAIVLSCVMVGCGLNNRDSQSLIVEENTENSIIVSEPQESIVEDNEGSDSMNKDIKVTIKGKEYAFSLENNETARAFLELLPNEWEMSELNGNEKYVYLNETLPTNSYNPKRIEAGDVMLYGNNCIVVFYKSFNTSYSYTRIGHIDNLLDLGNESIIIQFSI